MIPIQVKFDARYQQFKLVEEYKGHLFEDGEDYCLVTDDIFDEDNTDKYYNIQ